MKERVSEKERNKVKEKEARIRSYKRPIQTVMYIKLRFYLVFSLRFKKNQRPNIHSLYLVTVALVRTTQISNSVELQLYKSTKFLHWNFLNDYKIFVSNSACYSFSDHRYRTEVVKIIAVFEITPHINTLSR